tara:strand:- start:14 stop:577 length:564 start_codon:yes stop_codon:yes gene_type:complete
MAILQNDPTIERIEPNGVTEVKEFVFEDNEDIFVPAGTSYHRIITKDKSVIYQTFSSPQKYSKELLRRKNLPIEESYLIATSNNPPVSKYFKNKIVKPTKTDYSRGSFKRYFLQLATATDPFSIIEVSKKEFDEADSIYNKQVVTWSLSKDKLEMEKMNEKSVLFAEKTFPQIRMKIHNFVEFGKES